MFHGRKPSPARRRRLQAKLVEFARRPLVRLGNLGSLVEARDVCLLC
jgi:hypothetical protein